MSLLAYGVLGHYMPLPSPPPIVVPPPVEPPPVEPPVEPPPTPVGNDHDRLVMAAPGQISNKDLQAADMYYWSAEITDAIRRKNNDAVMKYRDVWDRIHPVTEIQVNAKTKIGTGEYTHAALIEPSTDIEPVFNKMRLSQAGVAKLINRNKKGWKYDSAPLRNFRKCNLEVEPLKPSKAWPGGFRIIRGQDYAGGVSFWEGGTPGWFRNAHDQWAMFQIHSNEQVQLYFKFMDNGQAAGFTCVGKNALQKQNFRGFPLEAGRDVVHVLRWEYRCGAGGYFRCYYQGKRRLNVEREIGGAAETFDLIYHPLMQYQNPPPLPATKDNEPILYVDRLWHTAVRG